MEDKLNIDEYRKIVYGMMAVENSHSMHIQSHFDENHKIVV